MNRIIPETKSRGNRSIKFVRLFSYFGLAAILLVTMICNALAQSLTVPNADFYLTAGYLTANGAPGTLNDAPVSTYGALGTAMAEITQGPDPDVSANATLTATAINDGLPVDASAEYIYYFGFEVPAGSSPIESIPVDVSAQGSANGNFSASIQLYHQLGTIRDFGEFTAGLAGYPTLTPTSTAQSVSIPANRIEEVIL